MTTARAALLAFAAVACIATLYAADAYQVQRRAALHLPAPVDPVAGNAEAAELLDLWPTADAATREQISARLCVIGRGMHWDEVGPQLAEFFREEGCY